VSAVTVIVTVRAPFTFTFVNILTNINVAAYVLINRLQNKYSKDKKTPTASPSTPSPQPGKKGKEQRQWSGGSGKISAKAAAALDRSGPASTEDVDQVARDTYLPSDGEKPQWVVEEEEAKEIEAAAAAGSSSSKWNFGNSYLGNLMQTVTGGKVLTKEDLKPVMANIMESLQGKNVAQEIADDICASVSARLEGQAMESFTSVHSVATAALKEAVQRVLTPRTSTDVLRQVMDAKAEGRVFSIVFVGINGVGKSTSLAKVGYFLKQHGLSVLIAACDTFRSGAVEQLKTHSRCLDAPLFDMGYAKDPSKVASAAMAHAQANNFDVVLIDTAGRMQNNEKLMRALATLIGENDPSLVLFVGEALVGNDGIDQLTMFDQSLVTYSPPGRAHRIDGIILTKFDTIDDKVGAALSMSYKSGQPIMFVGTGQKYTHLKRLNVNTVVKHMFSPPSL
jgi:signal recognition particle receptor subunit alpha